MLASPTERNRREIGGISPSMTKPTRGPAPPPAAPGRRRSPSKRAPEIAATTPGAGPQTLRKQARAVLLKGGHAGGARSEDLRRAMEAASRRDLRPFFARWVYAAAPDI